MVRPRRPWGEASAGACGAQAIRCVATSQKEPHPEERRLRRVSKDEECGLMVRDGARAPPHHEEWSLSDRLSTGLKQRRFRGVKVAYRLQSCASLSSAWASPFSENVSVVSVPFAETPLTTTSAALRMASTIRSSSAAFLIQRPSPWVYIA